ncbi:MAG TPA: aspartate carbamoyltransferase regulatory subunit [Clostridiales bacterium]|nr:aspartate carbamoyltransferase regulatory subunit [Clostridiales bacterium]
MLEVHRIQRGIVLDHITAGKGLKIFNKLMLDQADYSVFLLMNVPSQSMGKKDVIKIENKIDLDLDFLGLMDHHITINIIEDGKITQKRKLTIPKKVRGLISCHNPRCITNSDNYAQADFQLVSAETLEYRCGYCEEITRYVP